MESKNCVLDRVIALGFDLSKQQTALEFNLERLQSLCLSLTPLFKTATQAHPQHSEENLLLGVLTHRHGQLLKQLEEQQSSLSAMRAVIDSSLDAAYSANFKSPIVEELWLVMHLWLFVQGRLNMDYSLANDYATSVSVSLSSLMGVLPDKLRCEWNQSFYQGVELYVKSQDSRSGFKKLVQLVINRLRKPC